MVGVVSEFETEEATGRTETLGSQRYAINEFLGSQKYARIVRDWYWSTVDIQIS